MTFISLEDIGITNELLEMTSIPKEKLVTFWKEFERPFGCFSQWYTNPNGYFTFKVDQIPYILLGGLKNIQAELLADDTTNKVFREPNLNIIDGIEFNCAEKFMMVGKILLFDPTKLTKFLRLTNPHKIKDFGRYQVKNYNDTIWRKISLVWVTIGNWFKFQNINLRKILKLSGNRYIVEASPYDPIWGIGISANNVDILRPSRWKNIGKNKGQKPTNKLGEALMIVRSMLL